MKSRIIDLWIRIKASYWFLPSIMAIAAMFAAVLIVRVDAVTGTAWLAELSWLAPNQPAGARALLSAVAGSMITVAGVTFSMTLLAVSHASAQIGPRLLSGFMRDRGNQVTLGMFIATFLYCLLVLRTVRTGDLGAGGDTVFVPQLAILFALVLVLLSVVVLIYFFHHVPQSISVSNVIAQIGREMQTALENAYPDAAPDADAASGLQMAPQLHRQTLDYSGRGGYLRLVDVDGLLTFACQHELLVTVEQTQGSFVIGGDKIITIDAAQPLQAEDQQALRALLSWGDERTREQDVRYPAEQLLEILGKAMSPGVNGQYTALLCIDQIESAIGLLLTRAEPQAVFRDNDERPRVRLSTISRQTYLQELIDPLRQFIHDDWITTRHTLAALEALASRAPTGPLRACLTEKIEAIRAGRRPMSAIGAG